MVLHREIQEMGYPGGITRLRMFAHARRGSEPDPVVRFETPPGKQMQADFTQIRRGRDPLIAFVATLGYSRVSWVRFTRDERAEALRACLAEAFKYFGGVPQHVLFDNPSTIVIERDAYALGKHRWHALMLAAADAFGFTPRRCRPHRPEPRGRLSDSTASLATASKRWSAVSTRRRQPNWSGQ